MRGQRLWLAGLVMSIGYGLAEEGLRAEMVDQMIAVVNDEVITQRDLDEAFNPYRQQLEEQYDGPELEQHLQEAQQGILNTLIEDRLILSEAKRVGVPVSDEEVEERLAEVRRQFETDRAFELAMASEGVSMERLRQIYRNQVITRKLVDAEIRSRVSVQPAEIAAYYQGHLSEFQKPARVHLSNILVRIEALGDPASARRRAEEILGRLQGGESFADLARQFSQGPKAGEGGDLGFVPIGHMRPEIEAALAAVEPGGLTGIVQTEAGFHIFLVHERRPAESAVLEEVQQEIERLLKRRQFEKRMQEWLQKLRSKAYISTPGFEGE